MATVDILPGSQFTVLSGNRIRHNQTIYENVKTITMADGTVKTCADIIADAGGETYSDAELKRCVKVEGYDPDQNNRGVFSVYSNNSRQTSKNDNAQVPGRVEVEMFNFKGTSANNPILKMWADAGVTGLSNTWLGFRLVWGSTGKRAYVITYTSDFGEESQPTPAVTTDSTYMHYVQLAGIFRAPEPYQWTFTPPGTYYVPIKAMNLYRTTIGTDNTYVYRKVPINPISVQYGLNNPIAPGFGIFPHSVYVAYPNNFTIQHGWQFRDSVPDKDMTLITLESTDWDTPPVNQVRGLTAGWNGMVFGHWENTLMVCEPYRPHAWPDKYKIALPHKINATICDGNSLVVLTTGPAYVVYGAHPSVLQPEPLQHTQSSKEADLINGVRPPTRSVVRTPFGIAYASDEGISVEAGGRSSNLSDKHYDKIAWQGPYRDHFGKLRLGYSNEKVVMFAKDDPTVPSIMLSNETGQLSEISGYNVRNMFSLAGTDGLLVITGTGTNPSSLYRFEDSVANRTFCNWRSKKFIYSEPTLMGVGQVVGKGSVSINVYAGGVLVHQVSLSLVEDVPRQFRLPTGVRERQWEVEFLVNQNAEVREFYLAGTPLELKSV
ncbi:MAG TPA: hypothetical protein PKV98_04660 [Burkholderiaceae bacterium]|nr:hypothetical protein [Burkholderiaceae bacterium]